MSKPVLVELPENITIATAESLHEQLELLVHGSHDVTLSGVAVHRADTAGLQILYAFSEALKKQGASLIWSTPSSVLVDAAEQLGLTQHLNLNDL